MNANQTDKHGFDIRAYQLIARLRVTVNLWPICRFNVAVAPHPAVS
jgi:hypothetical protein